MDIMDACIMMMAWLIHASGSHSSDHLARRSMIAWPGAHKGGDRVAAASKKHGRSLG